MRWGVVATVKAPTQAGLNFAAHHLELGADHLFIYLDERNDESQSLLAAHPKITVIRTNQAYWTSDGKKRPPKHQVRQSRNANHAYAQANGVDWLMHMDVDEFLWPQKHSVRTLLSETPSAAQVARVRPVEALAPMHDLPTRITHFKAWISAKQGRAERSRSVYPTFGPYLRGGFLSHVQGKIFVRTGLEGMSIRIHNAFLNDVENPNSVELQNIDLCHFHATDWAEWTQTLAYRHKKGSYRAEMRAALPESQGGLTLHVLFDHLQKENGIRDFFEEVCLATPTHLKALQTHGLLRSYDLALDTSRQKHFPSFQA